MRAAPARLAAYFRHERENAAGEKVESYHSERVVAFDEEDRPLIVNNGRLEPATRFSDYEGLEDYDGGPSGYTALLPSGGWRIEYTYEHGGTYSAPLVGWALKAGLVVPLTTDADGYVTDMDGVHCEYRIYHPDCTETVTPTHPATATDGSTPA